ncbi:hypothetical protein [Sinomonas terrae]|uniref:Uncharacterized protein n=1 Tax=Sinomonas terrae TaxID=2908838 RepID=A0ABS9U426_9MICC|nr:hypothetical protein [Sinomonas terrae]MCH6471345.1 hypothetical protein [Sinomonas terrae]
MTELKIEQPSETADEAQPIEAVSPQPEAEPGVPADAILHDPVLAENQPQEADAEAQSAAEDRSEQVVPEPADGPVRPQRVIPILPPMPGHVPGRAKSLKQPRRISRRLGIAIGAALVAGGIIGALIGVAAQPDPTTSKAYLALKGNSSSQSAAMASDEASISDLQSQLSAYAAQSADLASEAATLQDRESAVASQEAAVQSAQTVIVANQITAGEYVVGKDVKAGTYHTTGPDGSNGAGCYYEWRSGTDASSSIIDNNISQGAATATLTDGQVFRTDGCQAWQKVG